MQNLPNTNNIMSEASGWGLSLGDVISMGYYGAFFSFMAFASLLPAGIVGLWFLVRFKSRKVRDKKVAFECGFDPFVKCCIPFTLRFYTIALLFLIVDVELVLFLPMIFSDALYLRRFSWLRKFFLVLFLGVLVVGIYHEDNEGNLEWKYNRNLNKTYGKTYLGSNKKYLKSVSRL